MDILAEWFKQYLIPGSFPFFLLGVTAGLLMLYAGKRASRWGKRWLTALVLLYILLATPAIAFGLEQLLQGDLGEPDAIQDVKAVDAVVVLGGGGASYSDGDREISVMSESSALRLLRGLRLWEQSDPEWIVVSGGDNPKAGLLTAESQTMQATLIDLGVPDDRILVESGSANTHDQAVNLRPLFERHAITSFVLVTSPTHLRRSYLTFIEAGFEPIPVAALEHSLAKKDTGSPLVPSLDALNASRNVMREMFALLYYALRGWI